MAPGKAIFEAKKAKLIAFFDKLAYFLIENFVCPSFLGSHTLPACRFLRRLACRFIFRDMNQIQELGIRGRIEQLLDLFIDYLASIKEYLIYKHITLFEAFLFGQAVLRGIWLAIFGLGNTGFNYYFGPWFWIALYSLAAVIHGLGFFLGWFNARIAAMYLHGFLWLFLTVLAGVSGITVPAAPNFLLFTIFSLIVIVRLLREKAGK